MDVFNEQIVERKKTSQDTVYSLLIYFASAVIAGTAIYAGILMPLVSFIFFCLAIAVVYGAWYLNTKFYVEFEYSITNGEMDIDKIIARRKRTRILTMKCNSIEDGGNYNSEKFKTSVFKTKLHAGIDTNSSAENKYLIFNHDKLGKTLLIFSPNDKIIEAMRPFSPKNIDLFKNN